MFKFLAKLPEWRILGYLGIIALGWHLLSIFGGVLASFSDLFLIIVLSWILSFLLEPLVNRLSKYGISKVHSSLLVYTLLFLIAVLLVWIVIPTTGKQLGQLAEVLPTLLPTDSPWTPRIEDFLSTTLANSVDIATSIASGLTSMILIFILSFYFLITKEQISELILKVIPDNYEEDYQFLETVVSKTFASFIRVQVFIGLVLGVVTFIVLTLLRVEFALSTAVVAGLLAMIPVVGPIVFIVPAGLSAFTVSVQTALIALAVLLIISQLISNIWAPRLVGKALNLHPLLVILAFVVGYKVGGIWGAIFAVPVMASISVVAKDLLHYWYEEADQK